MKEVDERKFVDLVNKNRSSLFRQKSISNKRILFGEESNILVTRRKIKYSLNDLYFIRKRAKTY
jgi:hypothetical protein